MGIPVCILNKATSKDNNKTHTEVHTERKREGFQTLGQFRLDEELGSVLASLPIFYRTLRDANMPLAVHLVRHRQCFKGGGRSFGVHVVSFWCVVVFKIWCGHVHVKLF